MSRRKKVPKAKRSAYLHADYEEVQEFNEASIKSHKRRKGKDVAIQLPHAIKSGTGQSATHGTGAYGNKSVQWVGAESHVHKGDKIVYEADGKKLYAGNGRGVDESSGNWDLIIDLASNLPYYNPVGCVKERSSERFSVLRKHLYGPPKVASEVLSLDWPDGGVIPAPLDFWLKLWELLPEKTVMMCVGGHGRTGTCLAALMIANGVTYYAAFDHVRANHCDRAIETVTQTRYLHGLYVEYLKRLIAVEKDPKQLMDLQTELTHATSHVPSAYSNHGEPEPIKKSSGSSGQSTGHYGNDYAGDRLKLIGNQLFEQICVDQVCAKANCMEPEHQGWVTYDVSREKVFTGSAH